MTLHLPRTIPLLRAKPMAFEPGLYEGAILVHAHNDKEGREAFQALMAPALDGMRFEFNIFRFGPMDISRRDPYRAMVSVKFERATKAGIDVLRKRTLASYVARSKKATERELQAGLTERVPLHTPTEAMWRAALEARQSFGQKPADWFVERIFMGEQDPEHAEVETVAYRLLDEENARRARKK
jgi:hypothetical protein